MTTKRKSSDAATLPLQVVEKNADAAILGTADATGRRFNHDLLLDEKDRQAAIQRWDRIALFLINPELLDEFKPYEARAKRLKCLVHRIGTLAVLLMMYSLVASACYLWARAGGKEEGTLLRLSIEISAILGLVCALLASRHGPWRRP